MRDGAHRPVAVEYFEDKPVLAEVLADCRERTRGSTVDLTLARSADGAELDMGTRFDLSFPEAVAEPKPEPVVRQPVTQRNEPAPAVSTSSVTVSTPSGAAAQSNNIIQ